MKFTSQHSILPDTLYRAVEPANFPETRLIFRNTAWSSRLLLDAELAEADGWINRFGRFQPFEGSFSQPLALCYHGHQFGVYNPDLGDGRGFLYAQVIDPVTGNCLDFGTKGSGQTPFSRGADGRLTLKGAIRELLATEMLDALGVNTSKTFAILETGEALQRHDEPSPTRSAVLTRLSHGHIRIGSFQRLIYMDDQQSLDALIRYTLKTYYASEDAEQISIAEAAERLLVVVAERLAHLVSSWMAAGFVHGVLNTDNFNVSGESFDYGPWRFLPFMNPGFTAAYFDHQSRYCYGRQPQATFWALCRLADCMVPFVAVERLETLVQRYHDILEQTMITATCRRLGIDASWDKAGELVAEFMKALKTSQLGFDEACFDWYGGESAYPRAKASIRASMYQARDFAMATDLLSHAPPHVEAQPDHIYFQKDDPMHLRIDQVESIWEPIAQADDWSRLHDALAQIHTMSDAYGLRQQAPDGILLSSVIRLS
ncbi:MAG: protein adenylyltransferase SelO family protein [Candidatus Puniceispirillales bacterium]